MGAGEHGSTAAGPDIIAELTQLLRRAVNAVAQAAADDPEHGYHRATQLLAVLQEHAEVTAAHRALCTLQVGVAHKLTFVKLADRLSTPQHPIGKARVGQLVAAARRLQS